MASINPLVIPAYHEHSGSVQITTQVQTGGPEIVDKIADEWRALCIESGDDQPFYRPEWVSAYLRSFVPGSLVVLVTARAGNRLTAVLPLVSERSFAFGFPARALRSASNVHSCRFELVKADGQEGVASVHAIWRQIRELPNWDFIALRDIPANGAAESLISAAEGDGFGVIRRKSICSPYVTIAPGSSGFEPYQFIRSGRSRNNMGRRWRKAVAAGDVSLRRVECANASALHSFFQLEQGGWKGVNKSAILSSSETTAFYTAVAHAAARFSYLALYLLEMNSVLIAAHLGLHLAGRYYSPKLAYDEQYEEYSPGHLIVGAILRDCAQRGGTVLDFMGPTVPWKEKWATGSTTHLKAYVFRKRLWGATLHFAAKQRFRLQPYVVRYLHWSGECHYRRPEYRQEPS